MKVNSIKIMADFCSSGIWDKKTGIMIDDQKSFRLPKAIKDSLRNWISKTYEKCFTKDYAPKKDYRLWDKMNLEGFKIACSIKKLYPNVLVYFVFENFESNYNLIDVEISKIKDTRHE